ncbi:MAG TPA: hypothetical protein VLY24_25155 [Bryobacteraceae bacterium]|nr:hypothetical protein [Bryobacteraceae bacterium]
MPIRSLEAPPHSLPTIPAMLIDLDLAQNRAPAVLAETPPQKL